MKLSFLILLIFSVSFLNGFEPHFSKDPTISPDGKTICFSYNSDLWIVPFSGGLAERLTSSIGENFNPVFSPDGKNIAFNSDRKGWKCVYTIPAEGGQAEIITEEKLNLVDYFPNGNNILCTGYEPEFNNKFFAVDQKKVVTELTEFGGKYGAVNRAGDRIIFNHWGKSIREAFKGSGNGDLFEYDLKKKEYRRLTRTDSSEMYPVYAGKNNSVFFAGSDGKVFQLFRVDDHDFSNPVQLTSFEHWSVKDVSIARANDRIVFEKFDEIWSYDPITTKIEKVAIEIQEDCHSNQIIKENVLNKAEKYKLSPDGKLVVFSYKYDLFAVPEKGDDVIRITRDQKGIKSIVIMNDHTIFFTKFEDGTPKLFKTNINNIEIIEKLPWSDNKNIKKIYSNNNKLIIRFSDQHRNDQIAVADSSGIDIEVIIDDQFIWQDFVISKDDRFGMYSELREELWSNHLHIYDFQTKEKRLIYNYDGFIGSIFWGKDDQTAFFSCGEDIYKVDLIPQNDFHSKEDNWKKILRNDDNTEQDSISLVIDFKDISKRIKPLISRSGKNRICYLPSDSTFYYLNIFEGKYKLREADYFAENDKVVYSFSGIVSNLEFNEKNNSFYFLQNGALKKMSITNKKPEPVKIEFKYEYNNLELNKDIFTQVWQKYGDNFYDPEMHGVDWAEAYQRFHPYTEFAYDVKILDTIVEEMMGEVNASHTRFIPRKEDKHKQYSSAYGGFVLDYSNYPEKGIRFKKIFRNSKLANPNNINTGDILLEIDGKPVGKGMAVEPLLINKVDEKIKLTISQNKKIRTVIIKGLNYWQNRNLYYEDWVDSRKEIVYELSDGRIGYLHIRWMSNKSFDRFLHDFYAENYRKEALLIDVRNNGGGNTHDKILEVLTKRIYAKVSRRYFDNQKHHVPHEAWSKPLALLINENSFSDAEIFPALFQHFDLGKVIGMPTAGAVIGTNNYTLMDGSKMRLPQNGWYLLDGTNLEGTGATPDIIIEPSPEQIIADDDIQLKEAVNQLLLEIEQ